MALRVQLSLMCTDVDLYNGLVLPLKEQRELHSLILRCLHAYYYSEQARNLIDGVVEDEETPGVASNQEVCDNIRNLLTMQSFLASELEQVISDGAEDVSNILSSVNKMAESNGVVKATETEYGSKVYQIEAKGQDSGVSVPAGAEIGKPGERLLKDEFLLMLLERVLKNQNDLEGVDMIHSVLGIVPKSDGQSVVENPRLSSKLVDSSAKDTVERVGNSTGSSVNEASSVATVTSGYITPIIGQPKAPAKAEFIQDEPEDASDALASLFDSI